MRAYNKSSFSKFEEVNQNGEPLQIVLLILLSKRERGKIYFESSIDDLIMI